MFFLEFYNLVLKTSIVSYDDLPFSVEKIRFNKGDFITKHGEIEDGVYFISNGIVEMSIKSYMIDKVIDFFFEKEMFCAYTSFLTQIPSDVQIVALTDCDIEMVKRESLFKAYEISLDANRFGRILTENGYLKKASREKDFLTKTAEERYIDMFKDGGSQYISCIPVNKIAKYIGIHPESLSRIRKKIIS